MDSGFVIKILMADNIKLGQPNNESCGHKCFSSPLFQNLGKATKKFGIRIYKYFCLAKEKSKLLLN